MTMKNKYIKSAKISEVKFRLLVKYFAHDIDAKTIASLTGLNSAHPKIPKLRPGKWRVYE